jgi:hypothetical protein
MITHVTALRNDIANLVTGATNTTFVSGTNQKMILYSGTIPANASTALSGNAAVSTITLITWGAASSGVCTVTGSSADNNAVGGTTTFFRLYQTAAVDPTNTIFQGACGTTSSFDLVLNNDTVNSGANVSLTSGSYTGPP